MTLPSVPCVYPNDTSAIKPLHSPSTPLMFLVESIDPKSNETSHHHHLLPSSPRDTLFLVDSTKHASKHLKPTAKQKIHRQHHHHHYHHHHHHHDHHHHPLRVSTFHVATEKIQPVHQPRRWCPSSEGPFSTPNQRLLGARLLRLGDMAAPERSQ